MKSKKYYLYFCITLFVLLSSSNAYSYTIASTSPGKWGDPLLGTGASISWSFMPTGPACDIHDCVDGSIHSMFDFMPFGFEAEVNRAFDVWSAVADLTFFEILDDGADLDAVTSSGDIRIGGHSFGRARGILGHAYFPPENGVSAAGDIHFNSDLDWVFSPDDTGINLFSIAMHEIGHSLGLGHTNVPNSVMNAVHNEFLNAPQFDDVAGMQYLYGAPITPIPLPSALLLFLFGIASITWIGAKGKRVNLYNN